MTSNDMMKQPADQVREYWQAIVRHNWQIYFTTLFRTLAAVAGIARQAVGGRLQLRLDAGYLDTQFGLGGLIRLEHGTYVSPMIGWRLTPTLTAVATYRRGFQRITGLTQSRNQFALTLDWRPDNTELGLTRP